MVIVWGANSRIYLAAHRTVFDALRRISTAFVEVLAVALETASLAVCARHIAVRSNTKSPAVDRQTSPKESPGTFSPANRRFGMIANEHAQLGRYTACINPRHR
jgi:hypothetical protein